MTHFPYRWQQSVPSESILAGCGKIEVQRVFLSIAHR
jgi:hypothetical protein